MDTFQNRHALFHGSNTVSDKLDLFQSLLDSKDLTSDQALALLNVIRPELETRQRSDPSLYRHYTQVMGSLHAQMPDVYEQTVTAWQQRRGNKPTIMSPQKAVKVLAETAHTSEIDEGIEEPEAAVEGQVRGGHNTTERAEPKETLGEVREIEEEHEEHEEEREEENEREEEKDEQPEEESEKEAEEKESDEKEENEEEHQGEEEKPEEEIEEKEAEPQEESEPEAEEESQEELEEEAEVEEAEPEEAGEITAEAERETEVEAAEASESSEVETEAESAEGNDHMATEAGEAAAEMEHMEVETAETELPEMDEEEPPVEGGE